MKNKEILPTLPANLTDGPALQTPKNTSPRPQTPLGDPPTLVTDPATNPTSKIIQQILQQAKDSFHLTIDKNFEDQFTSTATNLLEHEKMIAHNGRHYVKTCDESKHFTEIFIAHIVEKLIETLDDNPDWTPTSQNLQLIIQKVDTALKDEDDFYLEEGTFSWLDSKEPSGLSPSHSVDLTQSLEVPIIGEGDSSSTIVI